MNYFNKVLFELQCGCKILFLFIGHFFKQLINLIHFFHDLKFNLHAMTDNSPFLVVAVDDLKARHQAGASMIKVIMNKLKLII